MDSGGISDEVIVVDECIDVREGVRAAKRARVLEDTETDDSGSSATVSSGEVSPCLVRKKSRPKSAKKSVTKPPKEISMPREEERGDSGGDAAGRMSELGELEVSVSTLTDLVLKRMERISKYALANRNFAVGQKRELKAVMAQIRAVDAGVRKCVAIRQELDRELLKEFRYVRELRECEVRGGRGSVPGVNASATGKRAVGPMSFAAAARNKACVPTANSAFGFAIGTRPQTTVAGKEVFYFGRSQGTGDDTLIYVTGESCEELSEKLNSVLARVEVWMNANKLKINADKTKFMIVRSIRKEITAEVIIKCGDGVVIEQVEKMKYLGILRGRLTDQLRERIEIVGARNNRTTRQEMNVVLPV
ncbi:hypothetical protein KPH14_000898 [Odynerus spinipes]|uniref:Reverse transcriptase domain-containing protein n=1 Tax=Odynerus spinipes TaxID=1348599 RepID=A0AAD9RC62_9HYME|nr:hypothetical protein KPH14_000898 [Odynerus spinipes]